MRCRSVVIAFLLFSFGLCFGYSGRAREPQPVVLKRNGNEIEVTIGGKPFTTYYFDAAVAKAYFQPLRSAHGIVVTRGFPLRNSVPSAHERDPSLEPHQRPMYFAHGNIDGLDFWGEEVFKKYYGGTTKQRYGRMVFRKLEEMHDGRESGVIRADFDLESPNGVSLAEEMQTFTLRGDTETRTIDCEFVITASYGPVVIGDTKEGTFAIRVASELNSPPGRMVSSNGALGEKKIWGTRANWVDYSGIVEGEKVGIAIFDNPKSFRHPTYWHARAYGLFAANPFGIREFTQDPGQDGSWTIIKGQPLAFRYRVLIHHGNEKEARIAEAYEDYVAGK